MDISATRVSGANPTADVAARDSIVLLGQGVEGLLGLRDVDTGTPAKAPNLTASLLVISHKIWQLFKIGRDEPTGRGNIT